MKMKTQKTPKQSKQKGIYAHTEKHTHTHKHHETFQFLMKSENSAEQRQTDLRDSEAGNGEAGDDVRPEEPDIVLWAPLEDGEEELETQKELREETRCVVVELVERVVGEEDLRESVP